MLGLAVAAVGAAASAYGSSKAADAQKEAQREAVLLQREQMRRANELYSPYTKAGKQALGQYQANIGNQPSYQNVLADLVNDPGYQFRLQQGQQAVEGGAAARGNLLSGAHLKDLTEFSQGLASTEAGNAYNREFNAYNNQQNQLGNLMQMGFNSVSGQVGQQAQGANNLANLAMQGGQNQANYYTQMGNIGNNLASNLGFLAAMNGGGA